MSDTSSPANKIDVFVYCHGYLSNNKLYPIEMGLSEVNRYRQTRILISDLSELPCSSTDYDTNFLIYKNIHGIDSPFFFHNDEDKDRPYGTPYKYLGACLKLLYPRKTVFATKGSIQRMMFQEIVNDYYEVLDIEESFGLRNPIPVDVVNAPDLHRGYHNHGKHEMNCAGKIAWTYAESLRDKIKFFDLWPVNSRFWDDLPPYQQQPRFKNEPFWNDEGEEEEQQQTVAAIAKTDIWNSP